MANITTLSILSVPMRDKVIKAWKRSATIKWKYGVVKPRFGGIGIYLKGNKLRDYISGSVIAEYLARR